jgi:hypothetical protein
MPRTTFGLLHAMRSHQVSSPTVQESIAYGRPNACNLCHLDQTLGWAAQHLHAWYNQPVPELSEDDRTIAAGVQWILKGDAGQRALVAWGMGWESAKIGTRLAVSLSDLHVDRFYAAYVSMRGSHFKRCPGSLTFVYLSAPDCAGRSGDAGL